MIGSVSAAGADLDASSFAGNVSVVTGDLSVTGTTTIQAMAGDDVLLSNVLNDFGTIGVTGADTISIVDANSVTLDTVTAGADLTVTALTGSVTGTSTITVGTTLNINAAGTISSTQDVLATAGVTTLNASGNDISMTSATNDFQTLVITSGGDVTIGDANAINLGFADVSGTYDVSVGASTGIDIIGAIDAADLDFSAVAGNIRDTGGDLSVTGTATFATSGAADVLLDAPTNDFGSVAITQANNATIQDDNVIDVAASSINGTLTVLADAIDIVGSVSASDGILNVSAAAGDITDTGGDLSITGTTTITALVGDDAILDAAECHVSVTSGPANSGIANSVIGQRGLTSIDRLS